MDEEAIGEIVATLNEYEGSVLVVSHNRQFLESLKLTRVLRLGADGLTEIESVDAFVQVTSEAAREVVEACFHGHH